VSQTPIQPQSVTFREALATARAVRTRDDLPGALDHVAAGIAAALRCRSVVINLHRPSWDDFEVATVHGSQEARHALLGQASTWQQWAPYLAERFTRRGAQHVPAGSVAGQTGDAVLAVMRRANGDVLGVISADEQLDGAGPGDEDLDRLVTLAAVAAVAVERVGESERETRHRGAVERLVALSGATERTRQGVLDAVCAGVREALGFGRVAALLGDHGGLMRPAAAAGWTPHDPVFAHLALTLGQLEPLLQPVHERQGCHLLAREDAEAALGLDGATVYRSATNGHGPYAWQRHWLLAPLRDAAGDLRGVLWVDDPADRLLPSRDRLLLLRLFADQAAGALSARPEAASVLGGGAAGPVLGADQDPLTGLANRTKLADRLRHALQRVKRAETTVAVLFIDLDNFQHANDLLGHAAGDELLRMSAARIDEDVRPGDTVARFGGDEFVVLCEDVGSAADAMDVAERLRLLLAEPIPLAAGVAQVTASIGVALPDRPDRTAEALLQAADRAMYEAKAAGRDAARLATPGAGWP
jgi:diguanylate cyclase (GGDEF)-like protein